MADPTSPTVGLAGVAALVAEATGLQVPLILWAALGGYWAFRWLEPMPPLQRCGALAISALIGAVGAIPVALFAVAAGKYFLPWWPVLADAALLSKPIAATLGLLCHPVIGRQLIAIGNRKADEVTK